MRLVVLLMAALLAAACASFSPTPDDLASELLTSNAPRREFRRISDDIALDQATIQIMRARAAASGATLLALIHMSRGVHPYAVLAFFERGPEIDMIETAVYWGRVDGKWCTVVTASEVAAGPPRLSHRAPWLFTSRSIGDSGWTTTACNRAGRCSRALAHSVWNMGSARQSWGNHGSSGFAAERDWAY